MRWVAMTLLVVALCLTMVRLGQWQLHRLHGRRAANQIIRTNRSQPPVEWSRIMGAHPVPADQQWRRVTVTGTFDTTQQLQIRYRSNGGDDGSEIVTPIITADGHRVLVDRGFLKRSSSTGDDQRIPPAPSGTVTVVGNVKGNETGKDSATVPVDGKARLINSDVIGRIQGVTYVNGYVLAQSMHPAQQGLVPVMLPDLDEGPHLSYAIQWFCFTAIAVVGLGILIRNDIKDRRSGRERRRSRGRGAHARPSPSGSGATRNPHRSGEPARSPEPATCPVHTNDTEAGSAKPDTASTKPAGGATDAKPSAESS